MSWYYLLQRAKKKKKGSGGGKNCLYVGLSLMVGAPCFSSLAWH